MADEDRVNVMQVEKEVDPFSEKAPKPEKSEKVSKQSRKEARKKNLLARKAKNDEVLAKKSAENADIDRQLKLLEMSKEEHTEYTKKLDTNCKCLAAGIFFNAYNNSSGENISKVEIKNAIMAAAKTPEQKEYFEKKLHA